MYAVQHECANTDISTILYLKRNSHLIICEKVSSKYIKLTFTYVVIRY